MIILIILGYVLNVLLTRWLNKILYKRRLFEILPAWWFVPIVPTIGFGAVLFFESFDGKGNWFTGKNW